MTPKIECVACHHSIDAEARLCPYCGADPRTGQRFDPKPLLEKHFPRRGELTRTESMVEFFRERQTIIVTVVIALMFLGVVALHRFITARNLQQVSDVPAVPLTEVADLSNRLQQTETARIPDLQFQYSGSAQRMQAMLIEPGAVPPPTPPDLGADTPELQRLTDTRPPRPRPAPDPLTTTTDTMTTATTTTAEADEADVETEEAEDEPPPTTTTTTATETSPPR